MNVFNEYGRVGQNKYAGVFDEEFLTELKGIKGIEVYKEMSDNDDIIGAMLFAIEMLIRQVKWDIEPKGNKRKDKEAAQFVKSCLNDMQQSWQDTVSEILSFLIYGWSYHEICYKRRMGRNRNSILNSKYNDGLIGWKRLPIRSQDTLYRWEYDNNDELTGMSQIAPPDYMIKTIPIEKALHFVTKSRKNNPEGRSILRNSYVDYYYKKYFRQIEGIGIERDLAGLPVLQLPEDLNLLNETDENAMKALIYAQKLVTNIKRNEKSGIVLPYGWNFSLVNGGSRRQIDVGKRINEINTNIAMTCMADFLFLGHEQTGSFALSSDKTKLFSVAIGTYLNIICEVFNNQAIPKLIDLNIQHFNGITDYPTLIHGDIEKQNLVDFSAYLEKMVGIGVITPDENLERYVRNLGDLPEQLENRDYPEIEDDTT